MSNQLVFGSPEANEIARRIRNYPAHLQQRIEELMKLAEQERRAAQELEEQANECWRRAHDFEARAEELEEDLELELAAREEEEDW